MSIHKYHLMVRDRIGRWNLRYRKFTPYACLLFIVLISHFPTLIGVVKSDSLALFGSVDIHFKPGPVPGQPYIDPNVGYTSQALGHLAAVDWLKGKIPWWNPYEGVGVPLAGEMQSAALFPPTLLLALGHGQFYFHMLLQFIGGVSTYLLVQRLIQRRSIGVFAGALFELNGTFAWLGNAPYNPVAFIPAMILGVEYAFGRKRTEKAIGLIVTSLSVGLAIYAGFPETAFIGCVFAGLWLLVRMGSSRPISWVSGARAIAGMVLGCFLAAPVIIAFIDYALQSDLGLHNGGFGSVHIPFEGLAMVVFPYIYGPISFFSANATSGTLASIWDSMGGYVGTGVAVLAIYGLFGDRQRPIRIFLMVWTVVALSATFGVPYAADVFRVLPGIKDVAFFRYAPPTWELSAVLLCSFALYDVAENELPPTRRTAGVILAAVIAIAIALCAFPVAKELRSDGNYDIFLAAVALWAEFVIMAVLFLINSGIKARYGMIVTLVLLDSLGAFLLPRFANPRTFTIDNRAISYLRIHLGDNRFYTLGPIQPNYGSYFEIASINNNDLPISSSWADYTTSHLDQNVNPITFTGTVLAKANGESPAQALRANIKNYEDIGVKYVVAQKGQSPLRKVFSIGTLSAGNVALPLGNKTSVSGLLTGVPKGQIDKVNVFIGNYGRTANGEIKVTLKGQHGGVDTGSQELVGSNDNSFISVPLDRPMTVSDNGALDFEISQINSSRPMALWLWPINKRSEDLTENGGTRLGGRVVAMRLEYRRVIPGVRRVYSDSLLSIYELPSPKPLYTVYNGQGSIAAAGFNHAVVESKTGGMVVRRELFMKGWEVTDDGVMEKVAPYGPLFQQVKIHPGKNVLDFSFTPPYTAPAAWVMMFSFLVIGAETFRLTRGRAQGS
ncbi:MAG: hypothetical protein OWT27_08835 [Firmicutes bacterium]|nr:hypothetical protein [Bacillota bacterium]